MDDDFDFVAFVKYDWFAAVKIAAKWAASLEGKDPTLQLDIGAKEAVRKDALEHLRRLEMNRVARVNARGSSSKTSDGEMLDWEANAPIAPDEILALWPGF